MEEISNLLSKHNSTSIDGKQIIWTPAVTRLNTHMKSEPLKRREQLKQPPRLKQKQISKFNQSKKKDCQENIQCLLCHTK